MPKPSESLEEKARRLAREIGRDNDDTLVISTVKRQIALTLEHIDRVRDLHVKLGDSLLQMQCYVDTELVRMEDRTPTYSPNRFPEREKFQKRLFVLDQERRRLAAAEEEKVQTLQEHLLALLSRHTHIQPVKTTPCKTHGKGPFLGSRTHETQVKDKGRKCVHNNDSSQDR